MQFCLALTRLLPAAGIAFISLLSVIPAEAANEVPFNASWSPSDPVPPGYGVTLDYHLLDVGAGALGISYGFALSYTSIWATMCSTGANCNPTPQKVLPIMIPLVGPWMLMSKSLQGDASFALIGSGEVAGALLMAYSIAFPKYKLVRISKDISVVPVPFVAGRIGVVGQF